MTPTNKLRLDRVFRGLRKHGVLARQNFWCCGGCASQAMADTLGKRPELLGGVYYTQQEGARLRSHRAPKGRRQPAYRRPVERVYLHYGAYGHPDTEERAADLRVAGMLVGELFKAGLTWEWNGRPEECVIVLLPGGIDA